MWAATTVVMTAVMSAVVWGHIEEMKTVVGLAARWAALMDDLMADRKAELMELSTELNWAARMAGQSAVMSAAMSVDKTAPHWVETTAVPRGVNKVEPRAAPKACCLAAYWDVSSADH